jgi:hypothetical protein
MLALGLFPVRSQAALVRGAARRTFVSAPERGGPGVFYAATCHPRLPTRRQFLMGGAAALASVGARSHFAHAGDKGTAIIRKYANFPDDPWAVCHGIRGMGKNFTMRAGGLAADWLLETQLTELSANGNRLPGFPLEVEVHPNMFLKTLMEAGVPLDYAFTQQGRRRTLRDVLEGARLLFRPSQVIGEPNMLPWSIIAFSLTTPPARGTWTNAWGEHVDFDAVVEDALRLYERASLPLMQAMRENRPETAQAPVHHFTCGGTHMLYALVAAVHAGYVGRDRAQRVRQQVDLMIWRLSADPGLIDRFYRQRAEQSGAFWYELDAKVKILGHGQECLASATRHGVVKLSPAQQKAWRAAVATLTRMLDDMETRNLAEARDIDRELFRQLVGDTCHSRHGLTMV